MEVTCIAILASLCMGIGAALVFVFAVKKNYFKDVEDAKYHVFWSGAFEALTATSAGAFGGYLTSRVFYATHRNSALYF